MERKTSEWPALHEVVKKKMDIIKAREKEHAQHVIDHGAPRTKPEVWLAALVLMKANRVWNNMLRGGTKEALLDSALDLGNYADFLAALLLDQETTPIGDLGPVQPPYPPFKHMPSDTTLPPGWKEMRETYGDPPPLVPSHYPLLSRADDPDLCFICGEPSKIELGGRDYCNAHTPVTHK